MKVNADDETRIKAEQTENALRLYQTGMDASLQKGLKQGKEEGLKQGKEEGLKQGKIEVAKSLLSMNLSIEQISKATGLGVEEIEKLR